MPSGSVPAGEPAYDGRDLPLIDLGPEGVRPPSETREDVGPVLIAMGHVAVTFLLLGGLVLIRSSRERYSVE